MKPVRFIVPAPIADILRDAGINVRYMRAEDLMSGEIGTCEGFRIIESPPAAFDVEANMPKQVTHGPQRKGRGGKIRRW